MFAERNPVIISEPLGAHIADVRKVDELRDKVATGAIVVFKAFAKTSEIDNLKAYLNQIRMGTLPRFVPVDHGAPDNYRINFDDPRAQIPACFHVWSFYPWNQNLLSLYERYRSVYHLRNLIVGLPQETFLGFEEELGCVARLSVQFYPSGRGHFCQHEDPFDVHQHVVPIMTMSKKGTDFSTGGSYVKIGVNEKLYVDEISEPGDIVLFDARCPHGVDMIDPERSFDPFSSEGRWMMLFAVNKTASNMAIADAKPVC